MPFVLSDGCRIFYKMDGEPSNPLLVLVHSLGSSHALWEPQMPLLSERFEVLRVDLRGHGASGAKPGIYTIESLAGDVLSAIETTGRPRFHYCGLSLGGMIGQWLAVHAPDRIERLVLANTSPRMPDPSLFDSRAKTVLREGMQAIEAAAMPRSFTARTLASSNPMIEKIRAILLSTDPVGYAGCCAAIRDMDQTSLLARIKAPVLVIGGEEDVSTPWAGHGDLLAGSIPGARALCLTAAAHLSNIEQADSFNAALVDFFLSEAIKPQ